MSRRPVSSRAPLLRSAALGAAMLAAPAPAPAQPADSATGEYFAQAGVLARAGLSPYGDLRWREDIVRGRPGAEGDLTLRRVTGRGGLAWAPAGSRLRAEAGARVTLGNDSRSSPWAPVLNESTDALEVDRLAMRITSPRGSVALAAGKMRSPLRLTEMLWDDDLRPVGVAATGRGGLSGTVGGRLGLAWLARSRADGEDGWLAGAQLAALFREEASSGAEVAIAWLSFGGLEHLAGRGIARQNATVVAATGPDYASEFDVLNLQLGARATLGRLPIAARLDLARNLAIGRDRDGLRLRVAAGGAGLPAGAEVGWVFQRVEREALPGAFNSDDWWFHTRMRGHQGWVRVGLGDRLEVRVAGFTERRDDLTRATRRLTAELRARLASG